MRCRPFGLVAVLVLVGVCVGQPTKPPDAADALRVFAGKVNPLPEPKGKSSTKPEDRGVALTSDDGTTYPIIEDDMSRMLFVDPRLQGRPVRLKAQLVAATKSLRVVSVQTVKDGKVYDVDYWCEQCAISLAQPGTCYCCGDEVVFRERPVQ